MMLYNHCSCYSWHNADTCWPSKPIYVVILSKTQEDPMCGYVENDCVIMGKFSHNIIQRSDIKYWLDVRNIPFPTVKDKQ